MRKFIFMSFAVLVFAASAAATSASAASTAPNKAPLIIAMRDPGCHWFYVGGGPGNRKYVESLTRSGPVTLLNLDEATLIIKGPGGTKKQRVGAKLTLSTKGTYRIRMVAQHPDDNTLTLKVT